MASRKKFSLKFWKNQLQRRIVQSRSVACSACSASWASGSPPPGQQHDLADAGHLGLGEETAHCRHRARQGQVRLIGDIDGGDAVEGGGPAFRPFPIEGWLCLARAEAHGPPLFFQPFDDPAAGLARAAQHQDSPLGPMIICHFDLPLINMRNSHI